MEPDVFTLRQSRFVLWRPSRTTVPPRLRIGKFAAGNPPTLTEVKQFDLAPMVGHDDVWAVDAAACGLADGVYHYWFEVSDSSPYHDGRRLLITDPFATSVDWRLRAPVPGPTYNDEDCDPAAVIAFRAGALVSCDPDGGPLRELAQLGTAASSPNRSTVIYELPASWARRGVEGTTEVDVGSFRDVLALVEPAAPAANFAGHPALAAGRAHLVDLGVNALELLPPADSWVGRQWGYATSNYSAPDYDLGMPQGNTSPTANADLLALVDGCHEHGIRVIIDMVMAFGTNSPMENANFPDFHVIPSIEPHGPDSYQSGGQGLRDGWGGQSWRYAKPIDGYDPLSGARLTSYPARQLMKAHLLRWMHDFRIDGVRMDSVNNVANWDFVQEFKDLAHAEWAEAGGEADRFLVVGEELSVPLDLIRQNRLDGLWNEHFKRFVRRAVTGRNADDEQSFEWTVRKMVDCTNLGFPNGAQAVNYLGSHDVGGMENERLCNYLDANHVYRKEERIKLAFACLLTSVGTPMIFAGDEFADEHDLGTGDGTKQRDPVNFDRLSDPWRQRVFDYVARLVRLRTKHPALAGDDCDFLHADFDQGKRILAWRRGAADGADQVVVLANFSDFASGEGVEYRVPWPATPAGHHWFEVTQQRRVADDWVGRESVYPWEAKVYVLSAG